MTDSSRITDRKKKYIHVEGLLKQLTQAFQIQSILLVQSIEFVVVEGDKNH